MLVSCSLLNAMEKQTNKKGNNPAEKMAKEVVDDMFEINRNKKSSKKMRSARLFHIHKDEFTNKIINNADSYDRVNNTNKLTEKKWNDLEKTVKLFLYHCTTKYRNKLIKEWDEAKELDKKMWINFSIYSHKYKTSELLQTLAKTNKIDMEKWIYFVSNPHDNELLDIQILNNQSESKRRFYVDKFEIDVALYSHGYERNEWGGARKIISNDN